jgi:hypothetical protein
MTSRTKTTKPDEEGLDIILKKLCESKYPVPGEHLEYAVKREREYSQNDFKRHIQHLIRNGYVVPSNNMQVSDVFGRNMTQYHYSVTVEGKIYYLSGGYAPTAYKKFIRFIKNDSGYGNAKWIFTTLIAVTSLIIAIMAHLKK